MTNYFIPYNGTQPAIVSINGHKLIVVSSDPSEVEESLGLFGADSMRALVGDDSPDECQQQLEELAESAEGGVVITPEDVDLVQMLSNLREELPWIQ